MMKSCQAFDKLPNGNGCCSQSWCRTCNSSSLGGVVDEWIKDGTARATIIDKYGEIENWDTSLVINMANVFNDKKTFNGDISKWNVSSVIDMGSSTSLSFFVSTRIWSCIHVHFFELILIYSQRNNFIILCSFYAFLTFFLLISLL